MGAIKSAQGHPYLAHDGRYYKVLFQIIPQIPVGRKYKNIL